MPGRSKAAARANQALQNLEPGTRALTKRQVAYDVVQAFRRLVPRARRVLLEILSNPDTPPRDRIRAAEVILDRALGKSPSTTVHAVVNAVAKDREQLEQAALEIMQRRGIIDAPQLDAPQRQLPPQGVYPGVGPGGVGGGSGSPEEKPEVPKRKRGRPRKNREGE